MRTTAAAESPTDRAWLAFVDGVRAFVARRVPSADAEDVAQDVMLRLHQGADALRDSDRAQAWAFTIARRTIADYYRARCPAEQVELDEERLEPGDDDRAAPPGPADGDAHETVLSWLRPMAEDLPEPYRGALLLADFEGARQEDVARAAGLSLSGAKSRVQRARRMLAERLERCCAIEIDAGGRVSEYRSRARGCSGC